MPFIKGIAGAVAGLALVATPVAASAAAPQPSAAKLSLRSGTSAGHPTRIGADVPTTTLISIGILAALVVVVLVATGGDDDSPDSN